MAEEAYTGSLAPRPGSKAAGSGGKGSDIQYVFTWHSLSAQTRDQREGSASEREPPSLTSLQRQGQRCKRSSSTDGALADGASCLETHSPFVYRPFSLSACLTLITPTPWGPRSPEAPLFP